MAQCKGEGLSIRLVSINIWDLPLPLPLAHRRLRRQRLLIQLSQLDADMFLIQEAFVPRFKQRVASAKPVFLWRRLF